MYMYVYGCCKYLFASLLATYYILVQLLLNLWANLLVTVCVLNEGDIHVHVTIYTIQFYPTIYIHVDSVLAYSIVCITKLGTCIYNVHVHVLVSPPVPVSVAGCVLEE